MKNPNLTPIFEDHCGHVSIRSYGKAIQFGPNNTDLSGPLSVIESIAKEHGLKDVLWQRPPNDNHPNRRFTVARRNEIPTQQGHVCTISNRLFDGVILTRPGQSVAMTSRDCPILMLSGENFVAGIHCGRTALQGFDMELLKDGSVIRNAFKFLFDRVGEPRNLRAVVTMGIAPEHFNNNRYPQVLAGIRNRWGPGIVSDDDHGRIDLLAFIRAQLSEVFNMMTSQVEWDGLDTFSDPRLVSHRAGDVETQNLGIISYNYS